MAVSDLPAWFLPLFGATLVTNMAYVASAFALSLRLGVPAIQAKGYEAPKLLGGNPVDLIKFLKFVFSEQHNTLDDVAISWLTWAVRLLFVGAMVLTLGVFGLALGLI